MEQKLKSDSYDFEAKKYNGIYMSKKILILLIFFILIIPIRTQYKDGGTVEYRAFLYRFIKWNKMLEFGEYKTGTDFILFPNNFNSLDYYDELRVPKLAINQDGHEIVCNTGSYTWEKIVSGKKVAASALAIAPTSMNYEKKLTINKTKNLEVISSNNIIRIEIYQNIKTDWHAKIEPQYKLNYINGIDLKEIDSGEYIIVINTTEDKNSAWYSCLISVF